MDLLVVLLLPSVCFAELLNSAGCVYPVQVYNIIPGINPLDLSVIVCRI